MTRFEVHLTTDLDLRITENVFYSGDRNTQAYRHFIKDTLGYEICKQKDATACIEFGFAQNSAMIRAKFTRFWLK